MAAVAFVLAVQVRHAAAGSELAHLHLTACLPGNPLLYCQLPCRTVQAAVHARQWSRENMQVCGTRVLGNSAACAMRPLAT